LSITIVIMFIAQATVNNQRGLFGCLKGLDLKFNDTNRAGEFRREGWSSQLAITYSIGWFRLDKPAPDRGKPLDLPQSRAGLHCRGGLWSV
jgi:hypothetical protein